METRFSSKDVHPALNLKPHRRSSYKNFLIAWPDILQLLSRTLLSLSLSYITIDSGATNSQYFNFDTFNSCVSLLDDSSCARTVSFLCLSPPTYIHTYIHTFPKESRSEYVTEETTPRCLIQYPSAGVPFFYRVKIKRAAFNRKSPFPRAHRRDRGGETSARLGGKTRTETTISGTLLSGCISERSSLLGNFLGKLTPNKSTLRWLPRDPWLADAR